MSLNVGLLLYQERKVNNFSQGEVCNGICSVSVYSEYELGDKMPDYLTLSRIFERIGFSLRGMTAYMSKDEFAYWEWNAKCNIAISEHRYDEIVELMQYADTFVNKMNKKLVKQHNLMIQGILAEKQSKNYEQASEFYLEAFELTVPNKKWKELLLGVTELKLYLCYLVSFFKEHPEKKEFIEQEAREIIRYIKGRNWGEEIIAKILPLYVCLWCSVSSEEEECTEKQFQLLQYCIKLDTNNNSLLCLEEMYQYIIEKGNTLAYGMDNYEDFLFKLKGLYKEFQIDCIDARFHSNHEIMVELIGDYLRKARERNGYSQDELSDGICSVESYSRIENGRTPNRNHYRALIQKLGLEERSYYDQLKTGKIDGIKLRRKINQDFNQKQFKNAKKHLDELKEILGSECKQNEQYLRFMDIRIKYGLNEIGRKDYYEELISILSETVDYNNIYEGRHTFTQLEIKIINRLAIIESINGNNESALQLLEYIVEQRGSLSSMDLYQYYDVKLAKLNMGKLLSNLGDVEKAKALFLSEAASDLKRNNALNLEEYLSESAFLMLSSERETAKKYFEYAMTICSIFKRTKYYQKIHNYYQQEFE